MRHSLGPSAQQLWRSLWVLTVTVNLLTWNPLLSCLMVVDFVENRLLMRWMSWNIFYSSLFCLSFFRVSYWPFIPGTAYGVLRIFYLFFLTGHTAYDDSKIIEPVLENLFWKKWKSRISSSFFQILTKGCGWHEHYESKVIWLPLK